VGTCKVLNAEEFKILNLIPQRSPMVMIDELVESDEQLTKTRLFIRDTNIFCHNGVLTEPGLIENIAQTGAARIGYAAAINNKMPPLGFIGAITNMNIFFLPRVGTELLSTIFIEYEIYNASIVRAQIENIGKLICECKLKIFIKSE
jgi:predicted hotdog family 3-hydroxylacyl-ACP dehydratase